MAALEQAARLAFASADDASQITYSWGEPAVWSDDNLLLMRSSSDQEPATLGTNRSRNEILECDVHFIVSRGGDPQTAQKAASARAYDLVGRLERYVRVTDTHLTAAGFTDGLWWCFMTAHEAQPFLFADNPTGKRAIEVRATFTAQVRITG